jgi:type I restriction enzyme S subunit
MIRGQDYSDGEVRTEGLYHVLPSVAAAYSRSTVRGGDLLLSIVGYVGTIAQVPDNLEGANLTQTTARLAVRPDYCARYFLHYLRSSAFQSEVKRFTKGSAQPGLNLGDVEVMRVAFPPIAGQRRIAEILDTLDEAIRKTEHLITKLKQMKQGLLHDLLTRGIDENGELRDPELHPEQFKKSPLGRIPKAWSAVKLEDVSEFVTSGSRGWAAYYATEGALFIRIGNLTRDHINLRLDKLIFVSPLSSGERQRTRLKAGDLLISITADLGIVGIVPGGIGEAYVNQHIALVRISAEKANGRWIGHYLSGPVAQQAIRRQNDSGAKAGLNLPTVRRMLTALPPRVEQDGIASRIDCIDQRIVVEENELQKLKLLKQGLMEDLLTGRVPVTPLLAESMP